MSELKSQDIIQQLKNTNNSLDPIVYYSLPIIGLVLLLAFMILLTSVFAIIMIILQAIVLWCISSLPIFILHSYIKSKKIKINK